MAKNTQKKRVLAKLQRDGYITRNECLNQRPAITRLSAIIQILEEDGLEFDARDERNDYIYRWLNRTKTDYVYVGNNTVKKVITKQ